MSRRKYTKTHIIEQQSRGDSVSKTIVGTKNPLLRLSSLQSKEEVLVCLSFTLIPNLGSVRPRLQVGDSCRCETKRVTGVCESSGVSEGNPPDYSGKPLYKFDRNVLSFLLKGDTYPTPFNEVRSSDPTLSPFGKWRVTTLDVEL